MTSKPPRAPRKAPAQERSRGTFDVILEGAARILARARGPLPLAPEGDKSPLTTNRVAEVAGVSIGSLYQYFPGKQAIVAALVQKRLRETYDPLLARIDRDAAPTLDEAVARLVDSFVEMKVAYDAIDAGMVEEALRQGLSGEAFALDAEYVARFARIIERWKPEVRADLPSETAAYVLFQGLRAVMVIGAFQRRDLLDDPRLRSELVRLVLGYVRA